MKTCVYKRFNNSLNRTVFKVICSSIRQLHWLYYIFDSLKKDKLIEVINNSLLDCMFFIH